MTIARSRLLRPEFFTDEVTGALSPCAQLLFIGLWTHSDINGIAEWSAKALRVAIFSYQDTVTVPQVQGWMAELEAAGLVVSFQTTSEQGAVKTWAWTKNFRKHQAFTTGERKSQKRNPLPPFVIDTEPDHGQTITPPPARPASSKSSNSLTSVKPQANIGPITPPPPPPPQPPPQPQSAGSDDPTPPAAAAPGQLDLIDNRGWSPDSAQQLATLLGGRSHLSGQPLAAEWANAFAGLEAEDVQRLWRAVGGAITLPSDFNAGRRAMAEHQEREAMAQAERALAAEQRRLRAEHQEREAKEMSERTAKARAAGEGDRGRAAKILAAYDADLPRWVAALPAAMKAQLDRLRKAVAEQQPVALMLSTAPLRDLPAELLAGVGEGVPA